MIKAFTATTLSVLFAFAAHAQISEGFDVISIKPSDPAVKGMQVGLSASGDFQAKGVTVEALIQDAFSLRPFQLSGGPGWIGTERYDVLTKSATPGLPESQLVRMSEADREAYREKLLAKVRLMLAERFQLKVHRETKELPIYGLAIAKSGSKLEQENDKSKLGGGMSIQRDATGKTVMTATNLPVTSLVKQLSNQVGRMVLDQTGLQGNYNFKMTWAPDLNTGNEPAALGNEGPSIFTAVQDQLGLKLDSQKGSVEVIVIDSLQKPSEN